ncbi:MAG: ABC transporter substrate-binding protein [Pseudomonadota bacterium]
MRQNAATSTAALHVSLQRSPRMWIQTYVLLVCVLSTLLSSMIARAAPAEVRLLSADAVVTEILLELGLVARLAGIDAASAMPTGYNLPRLGYHRGLAAEGIIATAPDVLIGSDQMGPPHVLDAVRGADIDVLVLPYPSDLPTLQANVDKIAKAVGVSSSKALQNKLTQDAEELEKKSLTNRKAALLLRGEGGVLRMAGAGTGGGGFVSLTGAQNVADYRGYRAITPEGLLDLEPELLFVLDAEGRGLDDFLERYPVMRFSEAVKADAVFAIEGKTLVAGIGPAAVNEALRVVSAIESNAR